MARTLIYAYPWDFEGDEMAAERAAALGVETVAVAASYHATRAARPLHPSRPLIDVAHAACYIRVRPSAWRGRRLVPKAPAWVESHDSFGAARERLGRAGLATRAWVVLTHNSALGADNPDLVVRNAFGDRYKYALCPSASDVVEYCATLVQEIVLAGPGDGLVLEACGPMGFEHNGPHEKISLAGWGKGTRDLLSLCFCTACCGRYADAGLEVRQLQERVKQGVLHSAGSVEEPLGQELADAVAAVRAAVSNDLRSLVTATVKDIVPTLHVSVHGSPGRWATGSFPTIAPATGANVDSLVANCFDTAEGNKAVAGLRALTETARGSTPEGGHRPRRPAVGGILRPGDSGSDEELLDFVRQLRAEGMGELHLYHLGLVGHAGLHTLGRLVTAFTDSRLAPL